MEDIQVWVDDSDEETKVVLKGINKNIDIQENDGEKVITVVTEEGGDKDVKVWVVKGGEEIPEEAKALMPEDMHFIHRDEAHDPNKGFLGVIMKKEVEVENNNGEETKSVKGVSDKGAYISEIVENSAAAEAGLMAEDIITALDGNSIADFEALSEYLGNKQKGDVVAITYLRGNKTMQTTATLKGGEGRFMVKKFQTNHEFISDDEGDGAKIFKIRKEIEGEGEGDHKVIIIKRIKKGEGEEEEVVEEIIRGGDDIDVNVETPSQLAIESINLFPNPSNGWVQVQFKAEPVATVVRINDINGKELFKQNMPDFDGNYNKAIDLNNAAKGTVILSIQQGDKIFTDKIVLN